MIPGCADSARHIFKPAPPCRTRPATASRGGARIVQTKLFVSWMTPALTSPPAFGSLFYGVGCGLWLVMLEKTSLAPPWRAAMAPRWHICGTLSPFQRDIAAAGACHPGFVLPPCCSCLFHDFVFLSCVYRVLVRDTVSVSTKKRKRKEKKTKEKINETARKEKKQEHQWAQQQPRVLGFECLWGTCCCWCMTALWCSY